MLNAQLTHFAGSTLTLGAPVTSSPASEAEGVGAESVFSPEQVEEMLMRRFNPLASLKASTLTAALDAFDIGDLAPAARLWVKMAERERWLKTVKDKREEAIELRPWLVEAEDDSPEAEDQQKVLEVFFGALRATHAMDRQITGGFTLLRRQMMESVSFKYANHHLRWEPDGGQTFDLPSGRAVPMLKLICEYVPLEYFEARTGALRFLGSDVAYTGKDLQEGHWMTTTGPALMVAASLAVYEGRLARHDRINLSEKWGQPGILGHTTGGKTSDQGKAMKTAVSSVASNYRGVLYGSDQNAVEFLWPTGSGGANTTPMKEIMEDVKREVTTLYLGGDLSTISREKAVGASVQGSGEEDRQSADCGRLNETLNATIVPTVIRWYFGDGARVLAKVVIEAPDNEDRDSLGTAVDLMVGLGAKVPVAPVAKRLGVPIAKDDEEVFERSNQSSVVSDQIGGRKSGRQGDKESGRAEGNPAEKPAVNSRAADDPAVGKLMASARDLFTSATAKDLQPLRSAIARVLQQFDDGATLEAARALYKAMPRLAAEIMPQLGNAEALYRSLSAATAEGLSKNPSLL